VVLLIGYGNDLRGDDAAGRLVAQRIRAYDAVAVEVHSVHQLTPEFAEIVAKTDRVVFVDAYVAAEGDPARAVHIARDAPGARLDHVGSPESLLALADCVYGSRPDAWLVTVPAVSFDYGAAPSATTRVGIDDAAVLALGLLAGMPVTSDEGSAVCTR
jgi:hydrogenase maturation protease